MREETDDGERRNRAMISGSVLSFIGGTGTSRWIASARPTRPHSVTGRHARTVRMTVLIGASDWRTTLDTLAAVLSNEAAVLVDVLRPALGEVQSQLGVCRLQPVTLCTPIHAGGEALQARWEDDETGVDVSSPTYTGTPVVSAGPTRDPGQVVAGGLLELTRVDKDASVRLVIAATSRSGCARCAVDGLLPELLHRRPVGTDDLLPGLSHAAVGEVAESIRTINLSGVRAEGLRITSAYLRGATNPARIQRALFPELTDPGHGRGGEA